MSSHLDYFSDKELAEVLRAYLSYALDVTQRLEARNYAVLGQDGLISLREILEKKVFITRSESI